VAIAVELGSQPGVAAGVADAVLVLTVNPAALAAGRSLGFRQWDGVDVSSPSYSSVFAGMGLHF